MVNWGASRDQHAEDISFDLASYYQGRAQRGLEGRSKAIAGVEDLWAHVDAPANVEVSAEGVVAVSQVPAGGCEILLLS